MSLHALGERLRTLTSAAQRRWTPNSSKDALGISSHEEEICNQEEEDEDSERKQQSSRTCWKEETHDAHVVTPLSEPLLRIPESRT